MARALALSWTALFLFAQVLIPYILTSLTFPNQYRVSQEMMPIWDKDNSNTVNSNALFWLAGPFKISSDNYNAGDDVSAWS